MTPSDLQSRLTQAYRRWLPLSQQMEPTFHDTLHTVLTTQGSLNRARLAFATGCAAGLSDKDAERLGIAVEYFHVASLLFDDMPSMDNAVMRRGKPCVHKLHGEAATVLAALALINRGHTLIWESMAGMPQASFSAVADLLDRTLGSRGICNGQAMDLFYGLGEPSPAQVARIAKEKTSALFVLSLELPALLAGAKPEIRRLLNRIATHWGEAYQIFDDLMDVSMADALSGKTAGQDARLQRPNMALSLGTDRAYQRLQAHCRAAQKLLQALIEHWPVANALMHFQERLLARVATLPEPVIAA